MNMLYVKKSLLIPLLGLFFATHIFNINAQTLHYTLPFKVVKQLKSDVYKIRDANGTIFILKRHDYPERALREIVGAEMGANVININQVQIIPAAIHLKDITSNPNEIFTLHTYINGEHSENNLILQAITNKYHLSNIAQKDFSLAHIAAFNIFINNHDCHYGNLFENKENNEFHLIDMDCAFKYDYDDLATMTENYLKTLKKRKLSSEKINALKNFNETLNNLINLYPPQTFYNLWIQKASELNYSYDPATKDKILTALQNHFNELEKVHIHINYLTKKPTLIETISNNMLDAPLYSFKKLNKISKNRLYLGILAASYLSCKMLNTFSDNAQAIHKSITKLQKKLI